ARGPPARLAAPSAFGRARRDGPARPVLPRLGSRRQRARPRDCGRPDARRQRSPRRDPSARRSARIAAGRRTRRYRDQYPLAPRPDRRQRDVRRARRDDRRAREDAFTVDARLLPARQDRYREPVPTAARPTETLRDRRTLELGGENVEIGYLI